MAAHAARRRRAARPDGTAVTRRDGDGRGPGALREVTGRITIVQEDRIRLLDDNELGYLLVVKKRSARHRDLERWRDLRTRVRVRFSGAPDGGAVAELIEPVG